MFQIGDEVTVVYPSHTHIPSKQAVIVDTIPAGESRTLETLQQYYNKEEGARIHKLGSLKVNRIVYRYGNNFGVVPDVPQNRGILTKYERHVLR